MTREDFGLPDEGEHDIGDGVTITLVEHQGEIVGLQEAHKDDSGNVCSGFVGFDGPHAVVGGPKWTVQSANPLTLAPSIRCRSCGHHGYIRNGRWVSA